MVTRKPKPIEKQGSCKVIICLGCEIRFLPVRKNQTYCSETCRIQHVKKPKWIERKRSNKVKKCLGCGEEFLPVHNAHKFCSTICSQRYRNKSKTPFDTELILVDGKYKWVRDGVVLDS